MPNIDLSVNTGQTKQLTFNCANTYMPEDIVFNITAAGGDANTTLSGVAYCNTAASTQAKTATMPGFALSSGQRIILYLSTTNSKSSATLNVNSTGAKTIRIGGANTTTSNFTAGYWICNYDGTYWVAEKMDNSKLANGAGYTTNTGTVTSVGLSNATNGGLTISGSPVTGSGSITVGHSNVLTNAQTNQAVYPIAIDKNGHISSYGSAVTIPTVSGKTVTLGTTGAAVMQVNGSDSGTVALPSAPPSTWLGTTSTTAAAGDHTHSGYLTSHQTIKVDGLTGATTNHYCYCETAGGTQDKVITFADGTHSFENGLRIIIRFKYTNTHSNPRFKFGNTTYNIYYKGTLVTNTSYNEVLQANSISEFVFDGHVSNKVGFWFVGDIDTNTNSGGTVTSVGISNGGGLTVSGSPITGSGTITIGHANSPITAGTNVGNNTTTSLSHGGTFVVPYFSYDTYGHITSANTKTLTLPSAGGSDNTFRVYFTVNNGTISCNHTIAEIYSAYTSGKIILGSYSATNSFSSLLHDCSSTHAKFLQVETTGGAVIRGLHSGGIDVWSFIEKTNLYTVIFTDDGSGVQYVSSPGFADIVDAINRTEPIIVGRLDSSSNVRDYVLTFHDFDSNSSTHTIKFTSYENGVIYEMIGEAIYSNGSYSNETWMEYVFLLSSGGGGGENYYPTAMSWTNGTSSGPTATITMNGTNNISVGAIPSANGTTNSGIVTTGNQTFGGVKTFSSSPKLSTNSITTSNGYTQTFPNAAGTIVNGTGTNGYLAKWTGTNKIAAGPQLGSSTTTFLRNDGTWAVPAGGGGVGSSVSVAAGESMNLGYMTGKITVDNVETEFIVPPARSVLGGGSRYEYTSQGLIRPRVEYDMTYNGYGGDDNTLSFGTSKNTDLESLAIFTEAPDPSAGRQIALLPIVTVYYTNSFNGRMEAAPFLALDYDTADRLGLFSGYSEYYFTPRLEK